MTCVTKGDKGDNVPFDPQFNLGIMYTNGEGVAKDHDQAVKWYKKAAKGGNANARKILKMWGEA